MPPVLARQAFEDPVGGFVLGTDRTGDERGPDSRQGEDDVPLVALQIGEQAIQAIEHGASEVVCRDGIEEILRRWTKQ